jgi:hypothetical protein
MKKVLTIGFLLILNNLFGQDINSIIKTDSKRVFGDTLLIFYGETIYFEANIVDNNIISFKQTNQIVDSSKTIEINLGQGAFSGKNSTDMKIKNPFDKILNYTAKIKTNKGYSFVETSVVPVFPKIYSIEMWPYKIEAIMLTNFKIK